jgi:hypothetical protein
MLAATVTDKHLPAPWQAFALRTADGGAIIFYSLQARLELAAPPGSPGLAGKPRKIGEPGCGQQVAGPFLAEHVKQPPHLVQ